MVARRERAGDPARNRAPVPALSGLPDRPAPPGPCIQGPSGQGAPNARDSVNRGRTRPVGGPPSGEEPLRPLSASVPDRSRLPRPPLRRCRPRPPPAPPPSSRSGSPPPPSAPPHPRRRQRDRARFHALPDLPATVSGKSASATPLRSRFRLRKGEPGHRNTPSFPLQPEYFHLVGTACPERPRLLWPICVLPTASILSVLSPQQPRLFQLISSSPILEHFPFQVSWAFPATVTLQGALLESRPCCVKGTLLASLPKTRRAEALVSDLASFFFFFLF